MQKSKILSYLLWAAIVFIYFHILIVYHMIFEYCLYQYFSLQFHFYAFKMSYRIIIIIGNLLRVSHIWYTDWGQNFGQTIIKSKFFCFWNFKKFALRPLITTNMKWIVELVSDLSFDDCFYFFLILIAYALYANFAQKFNKIMHSFDLRNQFTNLVLIVCQMSRLRKINERLQPLFWCHKV